MRHLLATVFIVLSLFGSAQAIERQQAINWCWAASIQDVLRQVGIRQSQAQIAATLDGWPRDRPAYIQEVVSLARYYGLTAWQAGRPGSPNELYLTLQTGWKIIAFVRPSDGPVGHYVVLQGIDPRGGGIIVSDPANGRTFSASLEELYYRWRWGDSVVIGDHRG